MSRIKQSTIKQIWQKAQKHYHSSLVGIPSDMENYQLCQCCDQPIKKQQISLFQHAKQFQIFGFGYPLWFSFLKYCIVLIIVLIASKTGTEIYMATKDNYEFCYGKQNSGNQVSQHVQGPSSHHEDHFLVDQKAIHLRHPSQQNHFYETLSHGFQSKKAQQSMSESHYNTGGHHQVKCTSFMVYFSIFKGTMMFRSEFLNILQFIIHLLTLIGIRNMIQKQQQYYDQRTCSLSDYSIMVSNLPPIYGTKQMIVRMFRQKFNKTYGLPNSQIKQFIYIFKSQKLHDYSKEKKNLQNNIYKYLEQEQGEDFGQRIKQLEGQIHRIQAQEKQQIREIKGAIGRDFVKCDKIIVIMNTEADKGEVIEDFEEAVERGEDYSSYFQQGNSHMHGKVNIQIKQAPQPNQINWEHIDQSDTARKVLILRGWLLTFLFLAVVTVVFYFIMLAKTNLFVSAIQMEQNEPDSQQAKNRKTFATVIVFLALFGVILFNKFIMGKILHIFVHMQRHAYTDKQGHSFALKYALGMFFTTAIMTLAVQAITFKNFYSHQYGVIEEQTIMFFVTAFFIPLVWLIHPYQLFKRFQHSKHSNRLVHQQQANQLIQHFPYDLGKRYAQVLEIMWFTFLYSQLIPLGSFFILVGLVLYYWVDKYNFLRRSALKSGISGKMPILGLKALDATLFLAPAGQVLFGFILHNQFNILGFILALLGIGYMFVPISNIIWYMNGQKFQIQEKTYTEAQYSFKQHYLTLHPVYHLTHKKQIGQFRKKVNQFYKQQFKKIKMYGAGRGNFVKKDDLQHSGGNKILV